MSMAGGSIFLQIRLTFPRLFHAFSFILTLQFALIRPVSIVHVAATWTFLFICMARVS